MPAQGVYERGCDGLLAKYLCVCIHILISMSSKNISITEDVYRELLAYKSTKESFTEMLRKLLKRKKRLSDFFGAWGILSKEEERGLRNAQKELRNSWKVWDKEIA